ncbi:MAG: hypothetical protein ACOYMN_09965 [Roseimicrobium sp.]
MLPHGQRPQPPRTRVLGTAQQSTLKQGRRFLYTIAARFMHRAHPGNLCHMSGLHRLRLLRSTSRNHVPLLLGAALQDVALLSQFAHQGIFPSGKVGQRELQFRQKLKAPGAGEIQSAIHNHVAL